MDHKQIESSQRQSNEHIQHQIIMDSLLTECQYKRFQMLKPILYPDGKEWCCLLGKDIQEGVVGFGKTPHDAIMNWDGAFNKGME